MLERFPDGWEVCGIWMDGVGRGGWTGWGMRGVLSEWTGWGVRGWEKGGGGGGGQRERHR